MYSFMYSRCMSLRPSAHDGAVATMIFAYAEHHPPFHLGHFWHDLIRTVRTSWL